MPASLQAPLSKPRWRGVSHQIACFVALVAGAALVSFAPGQRATVACAVYAASLVVLFAVSATYHRVQWTPRARKAMRRLDHAAIYFLIAGTYTPLCMLALDRGPGAVLLKVVWGGAALGVLKTLLWPQAPKPLSAFIYLILGCSLLPYVQQFKQALPATGMALILLGGVAYAAGSVTYALRRPDPSPQVFGYHEVFHLLVVIAAACHYSAVYVVIRQLPVR